MANSAFAIEDEDIIEVNSRNVIMRVVDYPSSTIHQKIDQYRKTWEGWTPAFFLESLR